MSQDWGGDKPLLVGNDIENPGNADRLRAAAQMFDWDCGFLYDSRHAGAQTVAGLCGSRLVSPEELASCGLPVIAIENTGDAHDLFRFRPPPGRFVVVVGNERRGIAPDVLRLAHDVVRIPVASVHINTINVAAAAAVALYYLSGGGQRSGTRGGRGRPDVLLAAPTDPIEVGSVVRSAACFGWSRRFIDDRRRAWFDTDRVTRSLGRGAARRGRNPIRVIPATGGARFEEVCVVSTQGDGEPLRAVDLARGPGQLVVINDEEGEARDHDWERLGHRVRRVRLEAEGEEQGASRPPLRLVASIVLAEIARRHPVHSRGGVGGYPDPGDAAGVAAGPIARRDRRHAAANAHARAGLPRGAHGGAT